MLCFLLTVAAPAKAGTIEFSDAVRVYGGTRQGRPANEIRLRVFSQSGRVADQSPSAQGSATSSTQQPSNGVQDPSQQPHGGATAGTTDGTLSQSGGQIETIDIGDVTGTVCDCTGPPPILDGKGFPLWPLFALAGIPLAFIPGGEENPPTFPPPTPPPPAIPEPATLLLFGSGLLALGARARRRYGRKQLEAETTPNVAEEV